jgi:DNA modification methylase
VIYCGDNLDRLANLPDACVDWIYIDPPFNSNRNYEVFWNDNREMRSFDDRHAFMDDWYPVQVKQTEKIGRPDVDMFEAVMMREERQKATWSTSLSPWTPNDRLSGSSRNSVERSSC